MSVGIVTTKITLDSQSGLLAQQLATVMREAVNLQTFLSAQTDTDLEALGYSSDDVALLKSAAGDMNTLAQIYLGAVGQSPPYDFRTFTLRIAGLQL